MVTTHYCMSEKYFYHCEKEDIYNNELKWLAIYCYWSHGRKVTRWPVSGGQWGQVSDDGTQCLILSHYPQHQSNVNTITPMMIWSLSTCSLVCVIKLLWPHKLQWFVISNFKNYMFALCWVPSLSLIGSWYRNISLLLSHLLHRVNLVFSFLHQLTNWVHSSFLQGCWLCEQMTPLKAISAPGLGLLTLTKPGYWVVSKLVNCSQLWPIVLTELLRWLLTSWKCYTQLDFISL